MRRVGLLALLAAAFAGSAAAWVECVEFPWNAVPRHLWESQLVWLKNIGITHVSLPSGPDATELSAALPDLIRILRRLDLEADLEAPVPAALEAQTRAHGGPLTDPPARLVRLSVLGPSAITEARERLAAGAPALLWSDVLDALTPAAGFHPGAVGFAGEERAAVAALRRNAQLSAYWGRSFDALKEVPGAGQRVQTAAVPSTSGRQLQSSAAPPLSVRQFVSAAGLSLVSVVNKSAAQWTGDLRVLYPALKRTIVLPAITVPARDALWLPVNVPLTRGPLCKDCSAFASVDHLVYATAELTSMEFENGILAMEFAAPVAGEVILQLSREPSGPLVAGGRPGSIDWDERSNRARLKFPAGSGPGNRVRIGLAIEPPDATAFFDNARVLLIGETNHLRAQFSSAAIAQRSRLRVPSTFTIGQMPAIEDLSLDYQIRVPEGSIPGDTVDIALEADGAQMSHARPQLLRPVRLEFSDAISVQLAANARMRLSPAVIPINQRTGREVTITVHNNAPEIRTFDLELRAEGLEFSPGRIQMAIGASASRDVIFRAFARNAVTGLRSGEVRVGGAVRMTQPVAFAVFAQNGVAAFEQNGFALLESPKYRAAFLPGRWLEFIASDTNQNLLTSGGTAFTGGPVQVRNDALVFGPAQRVVRMEELEQLASKSRSSSTK